ncbi:OmpA family protein [Bacteroides sp. 90-K9/2]|uniref:OmpA family protein n=1 Tax=Bacteroides sp. 90-K9/2 TaxID=3142453 RepID=UPI0039B48572
MIKRTVQLGKQIQFGFAFLLSLFCMVLPMSILAQKSTNQLFKISKWYIGSDAGVSFGRGAFCSFGADKTCIGYGFGLLGGYHINSFLSTEAELRYSRLGFGAYDCCKDLYLADGNRYYAPLAGAKSYRYGDLFSSVNLYELGLHLSIDFVKMFCPESRWSFLLSPAVYGVASKATVKTTEGENEVLKGDGQMHFGVGGDLGVGYQISPWVNLRLYTGMTYLTGKGIDAMPQTEHKTNYTWDTGVKVTFALGRSSKNKKQKPVEVVAVAPQPTEVAQPERPVVREEAPQPKTEAKVEMVQPKQAVSQPTETVVYETTIYFSRNQCKYIEESEYKTTVELLQALAEHPETQITLVGWADKTGTEARNETISARRAETVKRYLMNKGIAVERISAEGKGVDTKPTDDAKARRTEIKLILTEK